MNKKYIERHQALCIHDLVGNVHSVLEYIRVLADQYGSDARLDIDIHPNISGLNDVVELVIYYKELESDAEYQRRLKKEAAYRERAQKRKAEQEKEERREYERLKRKFEKVD